MPTIGSIARPASEERRATAGTARKNGVDRKVTSDAPPSSPTIHQT
jgi:hypothetical protein